MRNTHSGQTQHSEFWECVSPMDTTRKRQDISCKTGASDVNQGTVCVHHRNYQMGSTKDGRFGVTIMKQSARLLRVAQPGVGRLSTSGGGGGGAIQPSG